MGGFNQQCHSQSKRCTVTYLTLWVVMQQDSTMLSNGLQLECDLQGGSYEMKRTVTHVISNVDFKLFMYLRHVCVRLYKTRPTHSHPFELSETLIKPSFDGTLSVVMPQDLNE